MAKERKASVIYEGNASQLVYAFPFDYLRKKFVKVEDIYTNITELIIGVDYTVEDKQVRLVKGIPLGHSVKIYRETTTAPLVEWQDASVLRSADLSLQEVQLLHLAEETGDRVFDSGMSTAYDNPNCWDGQYKRIINVLDPIEDGDVVTLRYIKANQDSLLNQLKNTGETQNARLIATGDTQNARLVTTGNSYVSTMTTLKDTATDKATEATNQADLAKKWAVSETSPDGAEASKSAKTWAGDAKISASAAASSANASQTSATNSASSASVSTQKATDAANSATAAATSASKAASSATAAKASETNAASSASAAAASADRAATFDPTSYYTKDQVYTKPEVNTIKDNIISNPLVGNDVLWDYLHRLGENPTLPTTNNALTALGVFMSYFNQKNKIAHQPGQYGQLLNIPADRNVEATQLWIEQPSGKIYHRGGNRSIAINDTPFKRLLDTDDLSVVNGHIVINGNELWIQ